MNEVIEMQARNFIQVLAMLLLALWTAPGLAQASELEGEGQRPWDVNISSEDKQAARALFSEGNVYWTNGLLAKAVERYQQALHHWDHPTIHYNIADSLQSLNRPIEVQEHLTAALRYGGAPLDEGKRIRAQKTKAFVEQQLARLEIICDVPGTSVKMGDETLCNGPAHFVRWVIPSELTFTPSFSTEGYSQKLNKRRRTLRRGESVTLHFRMYSDEQLKQSQRWLPAWQPWAVLGGGVAAAAGGGWLYLHAREQHKQFDLEIQKCGGCLPPAETLALRARGDRLQRGASLAYAGSGATIITGLILLYANQEQTRFLTAEEYEQQMNIVPLLGEQNGAALTVHY